MKRKGWLFEQSGHEKFEDEFGLARYIPSQWFQYQLRGSGLKFCQTDGLLFTPEEQKVLIVEFKLKHTPAAYKQVEHKYVPVLRKVFPGWTICTCEVVRWYDPLIPFPVPVALKRHIEQTRPNEFGVHILNL